jgi:vacuolar-type H+-ATPase catalytic subunit A/Vma1
LTKYSETYNFAPIAKKATMTKKNVNIKKDRFKNVAAKRVQKVLDSMESLSRCANRNNYEYSDEDVTKLLKAIKDQMQTLELSFTEKSKSKSKTFSF